MTIFTRTFSFITFLFYFCSLQAQSDTLQLPEIGWTAIIPPGFAPAEREKVRAATQKGIAAIEDATEITVDTNSLKTLASYYKEQYNMFSVTIQRYDPAIDGLYDSVSLNAHRLLFTTMKKNMPKCSIDSSSFKQMIGGQVFNAYRMNIQLNSKKLMTMMMYSTWYQGYDTGITYVALNEGIEAQIEEMLNRSSFTPTVSH